MAIYSVTTLALLLGFVFLFRIQLLRVSKVAVNGNTFLKSEDLAAVVLSRMSGSRFLLFPGNSIFFYDGDEVEKKLLKNFPQIDEVSLTTDFPKSLALTVKEHSTYGLFCERDVCAFVDTSGEVFQRAPTYSEGVFPTFTLSGSSTAKKIGTGNDFEKFRLLPEEEFSSLKKFTDQLVKINARVDKIVIDSDRDYKLYTEDGWHIILGKGTDINAAVSNLDILLREKVRGNRNLLDYVDLRFGNKIFYKFKE